MTDSEGQPRPSVIVMAAGQGSRFGGAKQLEPVGPSGERLFEYAIFDARRVGFSHFVLVIHADLRAPFADLVARLPDDIDVQCAIQNTDELPPGFDRRLGRIRPWGTVQAVLAARAAVPGSFVVLNADDFYGAGAYALARAACAKAADPGHATLVGLPLDTTLSPHGPVVRAVCEFSDGWLTRLEEVHGLQRKSLDIEGRTQQGEPRSFSGDEIVSMNLWVLPHMAFRLLADCFESFLEARGQEYDAELPLPVAVSELIARHAIQVRVQEAPGPWFGMTHQADRARTASGLRDLVARGEYPETLWNSG